MSGILQFILPSIYLICSIKYILCFNDFCHAYSNYTNLFIVIIYMNVAWTSLMEFATRKTAFANANTQIGKCKNLMFYVQWYCGTCTDIGAITQYLKDNKIQHIIIIWSKCRQNVTERCQKVEVLDIKYIQTITYNAFFPHYHVNAILFITIKGVHLACFDDQDW